MEEVGLYISGIAGRDELPNIRIAGRDDAVEWSVNLLEGLQSLKLIDVGLIGIDDRFVGVVCTDSVIHVLLRHSMGSQQSLVPIFGDLRQVKIGLGRSEIT